LNCSGQVYLLSVVDWRFNYVYFVSGILRTLVANWEACLHSSANISLCINKLKIIFRPFIVRVVKVLGSLIKSVKIIIDALNRYCFLMKFI
jgi:hypothetical protein